MSGDEERRSLGFQDRINKHLEQAEKSIRAGSSSDVLNSINALRVKQEKRVGLVTKTEERVDYLLDQLLSHNGEDLDGVRAVTIPQEHLQIKPVKPPNSALPDMRSVHMNKMNASGGNLPKRHSIISDVLYAFKSAKSVSPTTPSPPRNVASPTSSESLLAMTSSINRHFSLFSRTPKDLCSAHDIPTMTNSLTRHNKRKPANVESSNLVGKFDDADLSSFVDDSVPLPARSNAKIEASEIPATSLEQPVDSNIILGTEHHSEDNHIPEDGSRATKKISKARARSQQDKCKTSLQPRMHKNNRTLRRHSLAVAGTSWENGVRRTTRIRTRPLEYWRGERLLLGRVEKSLVTVIGMKYTSSEDEKPHFKVKSYVPDKYKDLVEKAASH